MGDDFSPRVAHAAIFDLDGTLLDTLSDLADAVNAALAANGFPEHREEAVRSFIGDGAANLIRRALPATDREDAAVHRSTLDAFAIHYGENFANKTRPYDGVMAMLEQLRQRQVPMGILSNKPHRFTQLCSQAYFGAQGEFFSLVLGQRDSVPKKPDPGGALELARHLGVPPESCAYIGDSGVDMQTAVAAGMLPLGVAWGFRPVAELEAQGAASILENPAELSSYLVSSD